MSDQVGLTTFFSIYMIIIFMTIVFDKHRQFLPIVLNDGQNGFICEIYENMDHIWFDPLSILNTWHTGWCGRHWESIC